MQSTTMILTSLLAAGALASPFSAGRPEMCNMAPTGPAPGNHAPFLEPAARTAELCLRQCEAEPACLSFVFGLAPSAWVPRCLLFTVPGWQVPGQGDDLNVFDRGCSGVPSGEPSRHEPVGPSRGQPDHHSAAPPAQSAHSGPPAQSAHSAPPAQSAHSAPPAQSAHSAPPAQSAHSAPPAQSAHSAPPAQSAAPANPAPSPPKAGDNHKRDAAHKCGDAPTGPADDTPAPAPLRTDPNVDSERACLALCKQTPGCKSVEFGKPSPRAASECRLFVVEAARLHAPGDGQSFNAFDSSC